MLSPATLIERFPFLRRLVPSLLRRYAKAFKHRYLVEKRMGLLFLLDQQNSVDRNLLIKGAWEPEQIKTLRAQISVARHPDRETVFLDIGAHGALYSMMMVQEGLADHVFALEPDPVNLVQLKANLFINGMLNQITLIEKAASDAPGNIRFFMADSANRGGSRMTEAGDGEIANETIVEADRIDNMVPLKGVFVVAKIDVEGSEMKVLTGLEAIIANNTCLFQIESFAENEKILNTWMIERGFRHVSTIDFDHFYLKS
jgi:FkbM family methyltransferase